MKRMDDDSRTTNPNEGVERHTHETVPLDAVCNKKNYPEQPDEQIAKEPQVPEPASTDI